MKLRILIIMFLLIHQLTFGQKKLIELDKSDNYKTYSFPLIGEKPENVIILKIKEQMWRNLDKISNYKNIQVLRIEQSEISELVIDFNQFPFLQSLYVQGSKFDTLIFKGNGMHFKELMVYDEHLENYNFLNAIPLLEEICLSDSQTIDVDNLIDNLLPLKSLSSVYLCDGNIVKLPSAFKKFNRLEWLTLRDLDSLFDYDYNIDLIKDIEIDNLSFMYNSSKAALSGNIKLLKKIKRLYLGNTSFSSLPEEIGELIQLEELNMSMCDIQELPKSIIKLVNLKKLMLMPCSFKEIPPVLYDMVWLEELEIGSWEWFPTKEELKPLRKKLKKTKVNAFDEK